MNLHKDKELFKEIINEAADFLGFKTSHIEKDYWVTKILKDVVSSELGKQAYFKGGTSLSKAYGIIQRFSEDLDMLTYTGDDNASKSKEKALNKKVCDIIVSKNNEIYKPDLSKTGGNFRKLYFFYGNQYSQIGLKKNLEVEIKACDMPDKNLIYYPTETRMISPIVGEFLNKVGRKDLVIQFGLQSFEVQCVNPRKTICDKISRMVKLSYRENPVEEFSEHIRDLYDLHQILAHEEYNSFLNSNNFLDAMYRTTIEDRLMKNTRTDMPLGQAVIFNNPETILDDKRLQDAYFIELGKLMFNDAVMPTMDEIKQTIHDIAVRMPAFEVYRQQKEAELKDRQDKPAVEYTKISVYSDSTDNNLLIRCKADGIQMQGTKLSTEDKELYLCLLQNKRTAELEELRLRLADKYFSAGTDTGQDKGLKR